MCNREFKEVLSKKQLANFFQNPHDKILLFGVPYFCLFRTIDRGFKEVINKKQLVNFMHLGPYAKKGKEGKVRTARKGWRGKSLLYARKER